MNIEISPNGVRQILLRENMNTMGLRLAKLELLPKSLELPTWADIDNVGTSKSLGNYAVSFPW